MNFEENVDRTTLFSWGIFQVFGRKRVVFSGGGFGARHDSGIIRSYYGAQPARPSYLTLHQPTPDTPANRKQTHRLLVLYIPGMLLLVVRAQGSPGDSTLAEIDSDSAYGRSGGVVRRGGRFVHG